MKSKIYTIILSLLSLSASAQDTFAPVLSQIEQNSPTLQTLQKQMEAQKTAYRTGLTPQDLEVQFGYLWGNPSPIGNRKDVSISQEFDFPSVYARRSRLANKQGEAAEWQYRQERMQLLLKAKQTCIQLVYCNALSNLYQQQCDRARQIADAYERMIQQGTTNQLELDKTRLNRMTVEGKLSAVNIEKNKLLTELQAMNGGKSINLPDTTFTLSPLPMSFDDYLAEAEQHSPVLQYMQQQIAIADNNISVVRATTLPKWSIGYMGEFVRDNTFQGVTIGLSIPLWENKNRVRLAQRQAEVATQQNNEALLQFRTNLRSLYERAVQLQNTDAQYKAVLSTNGLNLLNLAFEKGELSLLNYLLEQEYWTDAYDQRLQIQRDLALTLSELNAWKL